MLYTLKFNKALINDGVRDCPAHRHSFKLTRLSGLALAS